MIGKFVAYLVTTVNKDIELNAKKSKKLGMEEIRAIAKGLSCNIVIMDDPSEDGKKYRGTSNAFQEPLTIYTEKDMTMILYNQKEVKELAEGTLNIT